MFSFAASRVLLASVTRLDPLTIRYVASDMDGTILGADHTLSDFTKRTLFALTQERRIPFIFATGRQHADVAIVSDHLQEYFRVMRAKKGMTEDAQHSPAPVYLITSNGAIAHNARTNARIMNKCVPPDLVRELYTLLPASETRINTHLSQRDRWFCRIDWEEMLQFHKESRVGFEVLEKIPDTLSEADPRGGSSNKGDGAVNNIARGIDAPAGDLQDVSKVFFTSWDKPLLDQLERLLHTRYDDRLTVNYSAPYCLDLTAKGASKANALASVLSLMPPQLRSEAQLMEASETYGVSAEQDKAITARLAQTIAFGNDLNDASMLRAVGQGFVMGNSNPRLIAECPGMEIIGDHDEDGVARKICEVFDLHLEA